MSGEPEASSDLYTEHARDVIGAERALLGLPEGRDVTALAISGGGIRSASFALGVMQALVRGGILPHIDYLSTVSGGGYLGSSLTWFLRQGLPDGSPAGTAEDDFPFGQARRNNAFDGVDGAAKRNLILDYIRQHGTYLTPTPLLNLTSFVAVLLRAMSVSLAVYFALLTAVTWVMAELGLFSALPPALAPAFGFLPNRLLFAAFLLALAFVLASALFAVLTRFSGDGEYGRRVAVQGLFGKLLRFALACALLGTLPIVHDQLGGWLHTAWSAATAGGAAAGVFEFIQRQRPDHGQTEGAGSTARPLLAIMAVLYGLALGAYSLTRVFTDGRWELGEPLFGLAIALATVIGLVANVNYLGLHRMYRDRLMELFLPDAVAVAKGAWHPAKGADRARIDQFCGAHQPKPGGAIRPYHLINSNVVLVDSAIASYRGRGGDNFILSPLYCGSDATGWSRSSAYMKNDPSSASGGMTLPTAMAISGAAVNPNTGVSGRGLTRERAASTLLALLNLRLGYWAPHPMHCKGGKDRKPLRVPNFIDPGLRGGVLTGGMHERASVIELTDGGHFENLAVYELIRRRARTIFLCDGGQDARLTFDDLANLIERVRVDFSAKISFDVEGYGLDQLKPGSAESNQGAPLAASALARRGFAIGRIRYLGEDEPSSTLIYWKGTITPALSVDLYAYKNANPEFPHQSTADQFFDEDQFEAYRELGYYLGWQWLEDEQARKHFHPPSASTPPANGSKVDTQAPTLGAH